MKLRIVILGLSITSSWGNGHASIYRALVRELVQRGHSVLFLERDKPWYAQNRDLSQPQSKNVCLYYSLADVKRRFSNEIASADAVIVGSYVPEGAEVGRWVTETASETTAFYDLDTPVTMAQLRTGSCEYLDAGVIPKFSMYLSFTGGPLLKVLEETYGASMARALYWCVDPSLYFPDSATHCDFDLGYMGTYSPDRQRPLERLMLTAARLWPNGTFVVAGPMYPDETCWPKNVQRIEHVPPSEHRAFYNAQRFTLNITRGEMIRAGYSPSVRLFEAAACGTPIITDRWPGLEEFFTPGLEIIAAESSADVLRTVRELDPGEARTIADRARERVLREHTATNRAIQLEELIGGARPDAKWRQRLWSLKLIEFTE